MTTKNNRKIIGYTMYATAIAMPLSNYPQIYQLYTTHVTNGLSLTSWVIYTVFGLVPLFYAIANKLRPLVISNILWLLVDVLMIYGIVRFGMLNSGDSYERLLMINNIGKAINGLGLLCLSMAFALFAYDLLESEKNHGKAR